MTPYVDEQRGAEAEEAEYLFTKLSSLESEVERLKPLEEELRRLRGQVATLAAENEALEQMLCALQRKAGATGEFKIGGIS